MMSPMARDLMTVLGAFLGGTLVAAILGASNMGVALTFGQIAFAGALVWVMLRR